MCINTACEDTLSESPDSSYERKDFFITDKQADMAVFGNLQRTAHYLWR